MYLSHQTAHAEVQITHVCASECTCVIVDMCNEVRVDMGEGHDLTSSNLYFRKLLFWTHSQERRRDTEGGTEIYSQAVIMLVKITSSHHVYLSHLCKPQTALHSKSHFSQADCSVCSLNFSLPLLKEQPLQVNINLILIATFGEVMLFALI